MMKRRPCPSGSRLLKPFFKFKKLGYNGNMYVNKKQIQKIKYHLTFFFFRRTDWPLYNLKHQQKTLTGIFYSVFGF
jgi:hypothetical protein